MRLEQRLFTTLTYIIFIALLFALTGCASQAPDNNKAAKDAWMKKSYSPQKKSGKTSTLIKMPPGVRFRDHILKGKLAHGMNFHDALATLRMAPYGKHAQKSAFWCNDIRTQRCNARCTKCEAMLFGKTQIAMLGGIIQQLNVNTFYPSQFSDFRATVDEMAFEFADQIHRREIRHGMPAGLVQMIINLEGHQTTYYCANNTQPAAASCLGQCETCRVEITPRSSEQARQTIYLSTQNNQQRVTNVIDR